jgi:hypothetical protein
MEHIYNILSEVRNNIETYALFGSIGLGFGALIVKNYLYVKAQDEKMEKQELEHRMLETRLLGWNRLN